uniref:Uncharacterized protein n=1 Tax=Anguilla anguilla TaxID=7936 RepID=A0A0E9S3J4_ANGAN
MQDKLNQIPMLTANDWSFSLKHKQNNCIFVFFNKTTTPILNC